jgi:ParB-like chromosome segregation protein Spo0J
MTKRILLDGRSSDLERPVLVVKIRELGGAALIVDGWHRLAKAQRDGVAELPVVVLDEDQEYQVRIGAATRACRSSTDHPP